MTCIRGSRHNFHMASNPATLFSVTAVILLMTAIACENSDDGLGGDSRAATPRLTVITVTPVPIATVDAASSVVSETALPPTVPRCCGASCYAKRGNKRSDACHGPDRCCAIFPNSDYSSYDDTDSHYAWRRYVGDAFVWASVDTDQSGDNCTLLCAHSRSNSNSDGHATADVHSNTHSNRDSHSESDTSEYGNSESISDR